MLTGFGQVLQVVTQALQAIDPMLCTRFVLGDLHITVLELVPTHLADINVPLTGADRQIKYRYFDCLAGKNAKPFDHTVHLAPVFGILVAHSNHISAAKLCKVSRAVLFPDQFQGTPIFALVLSLRTRNLEVR